MHVAVSVNTCLKKIREGLSVLTVRNTMFDTHTHTYQNALSNRVSKFECVANKASCCSSLSPCGGGGGILPCNVIAVAWFVSNILKACDHLADRETPLRGQEARPLAFPGLSSLRTDP
jgi:hypothetical protein